MNFADRQRSALRPMAWVCVVLVLLITLLSAYMRLDKAGVGCQPWPQCYGQVAVDTAAVPSATPADAGPAPAIVAARLAHRVVAVAVLLLVLAMAATGFGTRPRWRRETAEVLVLLATTLFLAVLGVWTAKSRLPAVALGNLLGGFLMLALCLRLATHRPPSAPARWRAWIGLAAALVLLQVAMGGMASTTHSILSCGSVADCWSAAQASSWSALDPWRVPAPPGDGAGAPVQLAHRLGALAVLLCALPLALLMRRHDRAGALPLLACLLAQTVLGPLMVALGFPMALVLLHNLLAALTLALLARWL
ncbi:MAG: COX15/CtaA family protein [Burkholderiales bacterium]|nr:COX15/CtaA family protein [Burkholderiales bacterium]MBK8665574.1 COX15/CtaA family protein [Burkholderiales bacterium]